MSSKHDVVNVYKRVTTIVWQRLSPTFGIRTINAIAKNAIVRRAKSHPYLTNLTVTAEGLEWAGFEAQLGQVSEDELNAMMDDLMDEFFEAISIMIGRLVVGKIFAEAEEEIKKEGQQA